MAHPNAVLPDRGRRAHSGGSPSHPAGVRRYDAVPEGITSPPDLDDESQFVRLPRVPILDVHSHPTKGDVDLDLLRLLARNTNDRCRKGNYSLLFLGHTTDDGPETDQPPLAGFAKNFVVGRYDGRPCLLADKYIFRHMNKKRKDYPHRSVERIESKAPERNYIEAVAFLKRSPERHLGLLAYRESDDPSIRRVLYARDLPPLGAGGGKRRGRPVRYAGGPGMPLDETMDHDPSFGPVPGHIDIGQLIKDAVREAIGPAIREAVHAELAELIDHSDSAPPPPPGDPHGIPDDEDDDVPNEADEGGMDGMADDDLDDENEADEGDDVADDGDDADMDDDGEADDTADGDDNEPADDEDDDESGDEDRIRHEDSDDDEEDEDEPERYDAAMSSPTSTNSQTPMMGKKKSKTCYNRGKPMATTTKKKPASAKPGGEPIVRMRADLDETTKQVKYQKARADKLETQVEELKRENRTVKYRAALADEKRLGMVVDVEEELADLVNLDQDAFDKRFAKMKKTYRREPVGQGVIPQGEVPEVGPDGDNDTSMADAEGIARYSKRTECLGLTAVEVTKRYLADKAARKDAVDEFKARYRMSTRD